MTKTAVVTGGSRGLGRGVVEALVGRGMRVIAVARDRAQLEAAARETKCEIVVGDAADDVLAGKLIADHAPDLVVLAAGAMPPQRAIHLQTWESFSHNWHIDTKSAFVWVRNALLLPMKPGAHLVVISSGAALRGSPASGGDAAAQRAPGVIAGCARGAVARGPLWLPVRGPSARLNASN